MYLGYPIFRNNCFNKWWFQGGDSHPCSWDITQDITWEFSLKDILPVLGCLLQHIEKVEDYKEVSPVIDGNLWDSSSVLV